MTPDPFTLRELCWMAESRQRDAWYHTANLLAMLYNAFRGRGARALAPTDFHPFLRNNAAPVTLKQLVEMGALEARGHG